VKNRALALLNQVVRHPLYELPDSARDIPFYVLGMAPSRTTLDRARRQDDGGVLRYPRIAPDGAEMSSRPHEIGSLVADRPGDQGRESLVDDVSVAGAELAKEPSEHRLLYATGALEQPLHLSGTARLRIGLAASKPAANLSVWLVALPWEGGPIYHDVVTRGWADPQNHSSLRESEPLEPGRFYELEFTLQPDDQVIPAGQNLGLMIFSSDREFTLWPEPGTELTVDLDGTALSLPVVGGASALQQALGDG